MIDAVFFDLDNTLLQSDGDQFLEDFLGVLGQRLGVASDRFSEASMVAGAAVMSDHPDATNHELLVSTLAGELGLPVKQIDDSVRHFEAAEMGNLGLPWVLLPEARQVVQAVIAQGKQVVLATSPIYLEGPIRERMRRANVDDLDWTLVTTSDRLHSAKPHARYFTEAAQLIGCSPAACVMVGDNPFQDLPARKAGFLTYFVGQALPGLDTGPSGHLKDFPEWLQAQDIRQASGTYKPL